MENVIQFGWLGETRRSAVRALLAAEVSGWSRDWWVHHAEDEVDVGEGNPQAIQAGPGMPYVVADGNGVLAFHLGSKGIGVVGRHLAAGGHDEDAGLAAGLGEEALRDLAARIRRRAGVSACPEGARMQGPAEVQDDRLGACAIAFSLGRLKLELAIDRRLADRLVPPSSPQGLRLVARQDALDRASLRVAIAMDFGVVSLAHLADLKVGEVLVGDQRLEDALPLRVEGHGAVAAGFLRRQASHYAIVLDGHHHVERQAS